MSSFSDEMSRWIDQDNLIGSYPSPGKWTTGNAILETALAIAIEIEISGVKSDLSFLRRLISGIDACKVPGSTFNKNPGRVAQISHDDLIGAASTQRIASTSFASYITKYGEENGWDLSNDGSLYWDAQAKPWEIAFYQLCSGKRCSLYNLFLFMIEILASFVGVILSRASYSGLRLMWLKLKAIRGISPVLDLAGSLWCVAMARRFNNLGEVMRLYYEKDGHPYVQYGRAITFK